VNAHAPINRPPPEVGPVLTDRLLRLARPIADGSEGSGPHLRLQDSAQFFYAIEALKRLGDARLPETLCMILDPFTELQESAYDELYLWCLVELSRTDPRYVDTYWPLVLTLDLTRRPGPWRRPKGVQAYERPYRMSELLFYYYVINTLQMTAWPMPPRHRFETLGSHLQRLRPHLDSGQLGAARSSLTELVAAQGRPAFGDALGLLNERAPVKPNP
jgi:hypothetical protein